MSNSLDPDQTRHFVGPDLGSNCLQTLSADDSSFCLFDLFLYVPSTIFQLNREGSSWVEPVLSKDKCVLLMDHNAVMPVRLKPGVR